MIINYLWWLHKAYLTDPELYILKIQWKYIQIDKYIAQIINDQKKVK